MASSRYKLVIGNKMWSSWSLRPWLLMRQFDIAFTELPVALRTPDTPAAIRAVSPSGKIPALIEGDFTLWDSLAIVEMLADAHPDRAIWPRDPKARAMARAVSAEMHSGFMALRQNCPMDFTARDLAPADPGAIIADITRIVELWGFCRANYGAGGSFLFGPFTAADAMFAPVVSRFVSYGLAPTGDTFADAYIAAVMALPAMAEWAEGAKLEQKVSAS